MIRRSILLMMGCIVFIFGVASAEPLDLSTLTWTPYTYYTDITNDGIWKLSDNNHTVMETYEPNANLYLYEPDLTNFTITGTLGVMGSHDDDMIGLVFGYQDPGHFYLFDWKQNTTGDANKGCTVKKFYGPEGTTLGFNDFWNSSGTNISDILYPANGAGDGWIHNKEYTFVLDFAPGVFTIKIIDINDTLYDIYINDSSYVFGKFGLYCFSQDSAKFSNIELNIRLDNDGDSFTNDVDCDDDNSTVYPGAMELCDGLLNDCDGTLLDTEIDNDGDGYVECTIDAGGWDGNIAVIGGGDCDDANPEINPNTEWYYDEDGDGIGVPTTVMIQCQQPAGYVLNATDNCPAIYNPLQEDYDLDGIGDACDPCSNFPPVLTSVEDTTAMGYNAYFEFHPVVSDPDDESHTINYVEYPHWCSIQNDSLVGDVPDTIFAENLKVLVQDACNIDSLETLVLIYLCGNANGDETINVGDAVFLINHVFKGGPAPAPIEAGDANGDGMVNVGDAVYLISYIFKGGSGPVCPE